MLDIGGGQLAFLAVASWDGRGCVADIDDTGFAGLRARGIYTIEWNVALEIPLSTGASTRSSSPRSSRTSQSPDTSYSAASGRCCGPAVC